VVVPTYYLIAVGRCYVQRHEDEIFGEHKGPAHSSCRTNLIHCLTLLTCFIHTTQSFFKFSEYFQMIDYDGRGWYSSCLCSQVESGTGKEQKSASRCLKIQQGYR
jgi:hypothetical protein